MTWYVRKIAFSGLYDLKDLNGVLDVINKDFGLDLLFRFDVMNDPDDASRFMVCIPQNDIGLGKEALDNAKTIMPAMSSLASCTLSWREAHEPSSIKNRLATAELSEVLSNVDVPRYLSLMGLF